MVFGVCQSIWEEGTRIREEGEGKKKEEKKKKRKNKKVCSLFRVVIDSKTTCVLSGGVQVVSSFSEEGSNSTLRETCSSER